MAGRWEAYRIVSCTKHIFLSQKERQKRGYTCEFVMTLVPVQSQMFGCVLCFGTVHTELYGKRLCVEHVFHAWLSQIQQIEFVLVVVL